MSRLLTADHTCRQNEDQTLGMSHKSTDFAHLTVYDAVNRIRDKLLVYTIITPLGVSRPHLKSSGIAINGDA